MGNDATPSSTDLRLSLRVTYTLTQPHLLLAKRTPLYALDPGITQHSKCHLHVADVPTISRADHE